MGATDPHMIVVAPNPSGFSIGASKPFQGENGRLFKKLLQKIRTKAASLGDIKVYFTYAALIGAYEPKNTHFRACNPRLMKEIGSLKWSDKPPIIVTLGLEATKAVGVKATKITEIVGKEFEVKIQTPKGLTAFTVFPLFSMKHLSAKPGITAVQLSVLWKVVKKIFEVEEKEEVADNYIYPKTIEEVRKLVSEIIDYFDPSGKQGPENWPISIDTETNMLFPYPHKKPRVLILSVAWDRGKAAAILLDHPKNPYIDKVDEAWKEVKRLLVSQKPKVLHNWKFDQKYLEKIYKIPVNHVAWDTMLGEHFLDEDKKGLYSLKKLTPLYSPAHKGYDDDLKKILRESEIKLTDKDILEENEAPEGIDVSRWKELQKLIKEKDSFKKPSERTEEDKEKLSQIRKEISSLRKELGIKRRKKNEKKQLGSSTEGFENIPLKTLLKYAATDADVTRIIFTKQLQRLQATKTRDQGVSVMKNLYLPASRAISDMEFQGFAIDFKYLNSLIDEISGRLKEITKNLIAFDADMNPNYPPDVVKVMETMDFDPLDGGGSTSKDLLEKYIEMYPEDDDRFVFARNILDYRECHKTLHSFLLPFKEFAEEDGKIHGSFHLNGTATGRLSSSNPNQQNIPKITAQRTIKGQQIHPGYNVKKVFVPSQEDHVLVNVDIKGAELRVYTAYSHDQNMIKALNEGMDVHAFVTSLVYKIPYEEVMQRKKKKDPDIIAKRMNCKRTIFGTFYGAGPGKVAETTGLSFDEAKDLQRKLFESFPALPYYIEKTTEEVRRKGFVQTYFGRLRRFRLAHATDKHFNEAKREAVNFLIQSTSSDLVLSQLCEIHDNLGDLEGKMLITVHDSIVWEMPKKNIPKLKEFLDHWIVKRVSEKFTWLPVPFEYDLEVGPNYGELKELQTVYTSDK